MEPVADRVAGFKAVMPVFLGVLPQPEVAALVEYIKSLRDTHPQSGVTLPTLQITSPVPGDAGAPPPDVPSSSRLP